MINETTISKLTKMRLINMANAHGNQLTYPTFVSFSFEKRIGLLVDL